MFSRPTQLKILMVLVVFIVLIAGGAKIYQGYEAHFRENAAQTNCAQSEMYHQDHVDTERGFHTDVVVCARP
jgi:uncharacterized protein YpmB